MTTNRDRLEAAIEGVLAKEAIPTPEIIRKWISKFCLIDDFRVDDEDAESLARSFEARHGVTMSLGSVITENDYEPWLDAAAADIDPYYWQRYKRLLAEKGFSNQVIASLDAVTSRTLSLLNKPDKPGPWDRRGMVVGHVQSGKTSNYTGLICKAADAGYKIIIVIAGIHNNLRNQTQMRIDEGFVGRDSARHNLNNREVVIGVGKYDQTRRPTPFTTFARDFDRSMVSGPDHDLKTLAEPAVFVIKKNPTTLNNLITWLGERTTNRLAKTIDLPMLLIDDEADNASINIKFRNDEVSRINGQIRQLLKIFDRSCYVGYTATPFANIFVDPASDDEMLGHDLFPRHFIVSLDPPTNYFGPDKVFGGPNNGKVIRHIDDNEPALPMRHRKDHVIQELPQSLVTATRAFVIARAIRLCRGHHRAHCSMLVNASWFTEVQRNLRNTMHGVLERIQDSARVHGALPSHEAMRDPEIARLRSVWEHEFSDSGAEWESVLERLHAAAAPIKVIEVNSRSSGALNYTEHAKHGLSVIAVGGFSLSRGLTLEGLMTTYFLRNSKMYDTLMQMARWFGYRSEYEDLCRVWMPEEAEDWYSHISESIEMLRAELRQMESSGSSPEEFGLRVRSHPDSLMVTARNKIGSGELITAKIGVDNQFIETHVLDRSPSSLKSNLEAARRMVESALRIAPDPPQHEPAGWLIGAVTSDIVTKFISEFKNHPGSHLTAPRPICEYIRSRADEELKYWDLLVASLKADRKATTMIDFQGLSVSLQRRSEGRLSDDHAIRIGNNQKVASRGIERVGLTSQEIAEAEKRYREEREFPEHERINYPDRIYRKIRKRPLLILHLLTNSRQDEKRSESTPLVAWSASFPPTSRPQDRVEFVVNTTWLMQGIQRSDLEDDETEYDDD